MDEYALSGCVLRVCVTPLRVCVCVDALAISQMLYPSQPLPAPLPPTDNIRVLVFCGQWKIFHSVYRNFYPYVKELQKEFEVWCAPNT